MKKIIFFLLVGFVYAWAVSYTSIHQYADRSGFKTFKEQFLKNDSTFTVQTPELPYYSGYRIYPCDGSSNCNEWCAKDWMRYRLYVPVEVLDELEVLIVTYANSSHYAMVYFVPDNSPVEMVDFNRYQEARYRSGWNIIDQGPQILFGNGGYDPVLYKVSNVEKFVLKDIQKYINQNGWLYITIAQADLVMNSWNGFQPDPRIVITAHYYLKPNVNKIDFLRKIRFTTNGDPVENFSTLSENPKLCSGQIVTVKGDNVGTYIFDPDKPVVTTQVTYTNGDLIHDIDVKAGNAPLEGIEVGANHNISLNVSLDDCLSLKEATATKGEIFYSQDGTEWSPSKERDVAYRYVKVEVASPDSSSIVLNPGDSFHFQLKTAVDSHCTKSSIESIMRLSYILKGDQETVTKSLSYTLSSTTSYSSSSSSSVSTRPSSSTPSYSSGSSSSDTKEACEARGGVWLDSLGCRERLFSSSSKKSSKSSSSSSSSYSQASDGVMTKEACEARGGVWLDSLGCRGIEENASKSSETSGIVDTYEAKIASKVANKSYDIKGYYIQYPPNGAFDWLYISVDKKLVAKIEKPKSLDRYDWTIIHNEYNNTKIFDNITVENSKIAFGNLVGGNLPGNSQTFSSSSSAISEGGNQTSSSSRSSSAPDPATALPF